MSTTNILDLNNRIDALEKNVDSVENRVDAHTFGTAVDISSYTSSNKYTCPSDGYVYLSTSSVDSYVTASINNALISAMHGGSNYNSIFVKKGMKVWIATSNGTFGAWFLPLQ